MFYTKIYYKQHISYKGRLMSFLEKEDRLYQLLPVKHVVVYELYQNHMQHHNFKQVKFEKY